MARLFFFMLDAQAGPSRLREPFSCVRMSTWLPFLTVAGAVDMLGV